VRSRVSLDALDKWYTSRLLRETKHRLLSHPACILVTLLKDNYFFYKRTEIGIALLFVMTPNTAISANVANYVGRDFVETILQQDQYTFRELG